MVSARMARIAIAAPPAMTRASAQGKELCFKMNSSLLMKLEKAQGPQLSLRACRELVHIALSIQ